MSEEIAVITAEQMENLIYVIRGQKVMLDVDLAKIYGYETKSFNQQVKRNIEKFDDDFMFQLTEVEVNNLRSQNVTVKSKFVCKLLLGTCGAKGCLASLS